MYTNHVELTNNAFLIGLCAQKSLILRERVINFDARLISQLFVIALCTVNQTLDRKRNHKNGFACKFMSYLENLLMKILFLNDR